MSLREKYNQFREWQQQPIEFHFSSDEEHTCQCCGYRFKGNFCPCCAQKAETGRISWVSVHQGVMDIWGLGTRSLLRSLWNLLTRTGYFISEYISGKRQVSFPPVKMLFIVAVIFSFIAYWLLPDVLNTTLELTDPSDEHFNQFQIWSKNHYSWYMMGLAILAIIPTWLMFRYAPRHTRHTLPEGFFIQVFFSVLQITLFFLLIPLRVFNSMTFTVVASLFMMIYYIIGYKQLFGYGLWGTLWRQGFIYLGISCLEIGLILGVFGLEMEKKTIFHLNEEQTRMFFRILVPIVFLVLGLVILAVGFGINLIATKKERIQMRQNDLLNAKRADAVSES